MKYIKLFEQDELSKKEFKYFCGRVFNLYRLVGYDIEESPSGDNMGNVAMCRKKDSDISGGSIARIVGSIGIDGHNKNVGLVTIRITNIREANENLEDVLLCPFNKRWWILFGQQRDGVIEGVFDIPITELDFFETDPKYYQRKIITKRFDL